jgi:hypothetical protein
VSAMGEGSSAWLGLLSPQSGLCGGCAMLDAPERNALFRPSHRVLSGIEDRYLRLPVELNNGTLISLAKPG